MTPTETAELMQAVADVVQDQVALAMRDLVTKLAVAESQIVELKASGKALTDLRDRVVVFETKAAIPPVVPVAPVVDFGPIQDQLNVINGRVDSLSDIADRLEVKAAAPVVQHSEPPPPVDLTPVLERLAATEARLSTLGDVRDRVVSLESKTVTSMPEPVSLEPVLARVSQLELKAAETAPLIASVVDVQKDITAIRERLAVVETRPQMPGPPGEQGPAGKDGTNGKDGLAGLSFEGVYQDGKAYEPGNLVTWAGSSWHCNATTTTKPGDGSKDWTLMVKRGRDGRDGQDAKTTPIVSVGRPQ